MVVSGRVHRPQSIPDWEPSYNPEALPSFHVFSRHYVQLANQPASALLIVRLSQLVLVFINALSQKRRLVPLPFKPIAVVLPTMVLSETRGHTAISGRARGHKVGQGPRPLGTWDDF